MASFMAVVLSCIDFSGPDSHKASHYNKSSGWDCTQMHLVGPSLRVQIDPDDRFAKFSMIPRPPLRKATKAKKSIVKKPAAARAPQKMTQKTILKKPCRSRAK